MRLGDVLAQVLGEVFDLPVEVAAEIVADLRLMNEDLDCAFDDTRADPEGDARKLYAGLTKNPALLKWLENRARLARETLNSLAS